VSTRLTTVYGVEESAGVVQLVRRVTVNGVLENDAGVVQVARQVTVLPLGVYWSLGGGGGGGGAVDSVNGQTGVVVLDAAAVGAATAAQGVKADTAVQPADLAPYATDADITALIGSAPGALNTLGELADALADDANFAATVTTALAGKQPLDADLSTLAGAGNSATLAATTASFTTADETKLDGIEALADVTDATNVNAAGAVMESDYNANTILAATTDNLPVPLTVGASTFLGRKATGNISAMSAAEATALLNAFSSTLKGLVPLSGGGTTNFLRADGTWAAPAGGGGGSAPAEVRHDYVAPYSYMATAPDGTAESADAWKITRITVNSSGVTATAVANPGVWNDRLTETYA
jgi:hypothetical protein